MKKENGHVRWWLLLFWMLTLLAIPILLFILDDSKKPLTPTEIAEKNLHRTLTSKKPNISWFSTECIEHSTKTDRWHLCEASGIDKKTEKNITVSAECPYTNSIDPENCIVTNIIPL